jgi:hypothetical protein
MDAFDADDSRLLGRKKRTLQKAARISKQPRVIAGVTIFSGREIKYDLAEPLGLGTDSWCRPTAPEKSTSRGIRRDALLTGAANRDSLLKEEGKVGRLVSV